MLNQRFQGAFTGDKLPLVRVGIVSDFNPTSYTANVTLEGSERLLAIPVLGMYGPSTGTDLVWLQNLRGAQVVLLLIGNTYHVLAPMAVPVSEPGVCAQPETLPSTANEVAVEEYRSEDAFRSFNPNRPTDLMSGDKLIRAEDGAELGLFRGGVAKLRASAACQFILGKYKDFARLMTRRFQLYTDFGEVDFFHGDDGAVGVSIKGGASFSSETHPSKSNWTVLINTGHCESDPSHRLTVETRDTSGTTQTKLTLSNDGKIDVFCNDSVNIEAKGKVDVLCHDSVSVEAKGKINVVGSKIDFN